MTDGQRGPALNTCPACLVRYFVAHRCDRGDPEGRPSAATRRGDTGPSCENCAHTGLTQRCGVCQDDLCVSCWEEPWLSLACGRCRRGRSAR